MKTIIKNVLPHSASHSLSIVGNRRTERLADSKWTSTKDVIDHHLKSFSDGDLEGILSDYAAEAVMFTPSGPLKGVAALRTTFQAMITEFRKPGAVFQMKQQSIEGDHAYILWNAETADNIYELGMDTFVVKNGKIVAQSFTSKITPKRQKRADSNQFDAGLKV